MQNFVSLGLIIKRRDMGEADSLVTIFSKNRGKITTIAKGVRKINSRRAGSLELLNQVKFFTSGRGKIPVLTEVETVLSFPNIKTNLEKLALAYLLLELTDQFLAEGQENQSVYELLVQSLHEIDEAESLGRAKLIASSFQIKLLSEIGYLPELYQCVRCGEKLPAVGNYFSPHLGGLVDKKCSQTSIVNRQIDQTSIKLIRFLKSEELDNVTRLKTADLDVAEIAQLLNYYTIFYLEKDLGAERFALAVEKLALAR